ncbi:hypothetical protein SAMN04515691_2997 [Leifsonia sp. 98AMF]|nr:hypothetical protein SAMN04515690_1019 [Leifsonia sp. 197AMF]SDJ22378.1 hypothetical protein SAMN04515684_2763 [Leifsonia sp. 466MF]SDK61309.1 hypothetical protein SAMN04515683_4001 [Leifsonia sp. 157MF]SDN44070.1 hypothetical protein SAMN04515686_0947 [Leifsonia sp. 509MF]SEN66978.1 hypothetical protein SAMN04515685_3982 [Leifsonia sp. 467MF]SFM57621.1 hypothetical protein SAMN04515691_2997 [Leifsonia sp. 98AMF]
MRKRVTYRHPESTTARDRMKMAGAGALVAAGPVLGWIILSAYMPMGAAL